MLSPQAGRVVFILLWTRDGGGGGGAKECISSLIPKIAAMLEAKFFYILFIPHIP